MDTTIQNTQTNRLDYISWIQFVGVISVIFGHSMNSIDVPLWLVNIKGWVYTYHMPLFFFVSAYLFSYLGGFERRGYKGTFKSKFERLLVPYIIWNVAFFAPKILMSDYIPETVEWTPEYFIKLFFSPRDNILGHTWFLFALFEMYVLAILFEKLRNTRQLWIPVLAMLIILNCFGINDRFLAVGDIMKNAIFFWVGLLLGGAKKETIIDWANNKAFFVSLIILVVGCTVIWTFNKSMLINLLILGFSILLLLGVLQIRYGIKWSFIDFVSQNSFCIYIVHWPILMVIRFVFYQKLEVAPIPSTAIMFFGGIALASIVAWTLRRCKTPFMKKINKFVFGM